MMPCQVRAGFESYQKGYALGSNPWRKCREARHWASGWLSAWMASAPPMARAL